MKRIFIGLIIVLFFGFVPVYASVLNEIPPYIYFDGINEKDYNIIKTIKEEDVEIELEEKDTGIKYSWSFNKEEIKNSLKLNFDIDFDKATEPIVESITNGIDKMYIDFSYHGVLPTKAKIKVDVSKRFTNGSSLYLYYYDEDNNKVEFIEKDISVNDGYAEFEIDHCSKYFLTNAIVNDVKETPKILSKVIVALVATVIVLMAYTIFKR